MPKITINGKELEFKQGQTVIQVAAENNIDVPHFCWHPSLSVSGNCRMCLVEIEKMPKLAIACATLAADGMSVHVNSEKSVLARNAVMEFLLINHPLDCPICDEAGECKLQEYAFKHSRGESRFDEEKVHKDKRVELGPNVMFDAERCISCSRCIRFCEEIAEENELTFVKRGDRVTITTFPGEQLDNPYSMNVTDICPVGALTNRDFRFKARVWEMSFTKSICNGCARGCNIEIGVRNNEILRLHPRLNKDVNDYWMCDHGRLNTFKHVNAGDRVDGPHVRRDGQLMKADWDEVFSEAASQLKSFGPGEVAVIGSPYTACEDNFVAAKFAKSILGTKNVDFIRHIVPGDEDGLLIREDKTPNALGAELTGIKPGQGGMDLNGIIKGIESGRIKALYVLEDDPAIMDPAYEQALSKLNLLIVHATNFNNTTKYADIVFPASTYAEKNGTIVNFQGRLQRLRPAVATCDVDRTVEHMEQSRWDKFGTKFDKWAKGNKIDARPSWKIIATLSSTMGHKMKYHTVEDVFEEMTKTLPEFAKLDYDVVGETGVLLKETKSSVKV